ncbi:snapalysin family zinc-dependent metalloprotease [Kibdelosporangium philippinense]|uniref:Extracellular small neutral protease n=1 Tax=Kibdelosporangium philippinense TaxID=211113 RepID=A0ABS8ZAL5_9PSEU|nr:snapalysin family zinc-dependent metalloprotease [Kibdelosporangium philippinense]MCE7004850.1 snapalysin family zinc-dependent metalloprotease [Kibdelosporangium philippinense]
MLRRTLTGVMAAAALAVPLTAAPAAAAPAILATQLTYSDSQATQYSSQIAAAVQVWNSSVTNVQIRKATAGQRVNIRFVADPGWPRAQLGPVRTNQTLTIWMGRQAIDEGYNITRIASHEMGHSLGLPDIKPGPCSSLMSGSTGGVSCTNPNPNASEKASVQRNYAGTQVAGTGVVLQDAAY